eukprot:SAG11_NODE_18329_length_494_cov_0.789873_1_plen_161_part_10
MKYGKIKSKAVSFDGEFVGGDAPRRKQGTASLLRSASYSAASSRSGGEFKSASFDERKAAQGAVVEHMLDMARFELGGDVATGMVESDGGGRGGMNAVPLRDGTHGSTQRQPRQHKLPSSRARSLDYEALEPEPEARISWLSDDSFEGEMPEQTSKKKESK